MAKIFVKESEITVLSINENDYISLTDIARHKSDDPTAVISNWLRNRNTIEYLGTWETLFNPVFKPLEFEGFKKEAGLNAFTLSPHKWVSATGAIGIITRPGRYGGTYAHKDIAFKFASWISVEFELYMVKEFQRLKEQEQAQIGWSAKQWRDSNPDKKGNIRDHATINELICLSNLENINAVLIADGIPQSERLSKLNKTAIHQMQVLADVRSGNLIR